MVRFPAMVDGFVRRACLALAAVTLAACSDSAPPAGSALPAPAPAAGAATSRDTFTVAADLPPLSAVSVASAPRSVETVRSVYEFAARHPEVLSYVPCFCGCERAGHTHNADCFVGSRNAKGAVTSWEYHGLG
jgi:hypothetical protein